MLASFVTFMNHRARLALLMCGALAALVIVLSFNFSRGSTPVAKAYSEMNLPGFNLEKNWGGIVVEPIAIEFGPGGKIYVAEKRGRVLEFEDWTDNTANVVLDIRSRVHSGAGGTRNDRGLLDVAFHPNFASNPYLYAHYTWDVYIDKNGNPQNWNDLCPNPPGQNNGCIVQSRLARYTLTGSVFPTNTEVVMLQDFCQQFESHSVGTLTFGPDGALYMSHGEGANPDPTKVDHGQIGTPSTNFPGYPNACGDPPGAVGTAPNFQTATGGAFRSQGLMRPAGSKVSMHGSILRLDPLSLTGEAMSDNPLISHPMTQAQKIIGYGMRNPYRFTFRPGTSELWIGDVSAARWEELNRIISPTDNIVENFGWPCFEGDERQQDFKLYQGKVNNICASLYANETISDTRPYYKYFHGSDVVPTGDGCQPTFGSSISALAFYPPGGSFPVSYTNALFFGDYSRQCVWVMYAGSNGLPDPSTVKLFIKNIVPNPDPQGQGFFTPVDMKVGPDGNLYVVDFYNAEIVRVKYIPPGNDGPPIASISVNPSATGGAPFNPALSGSNSYTPDPGRSITAYEWDLDNDGQFDDATGSNTTVLFNNPGTYTVRLRVRDDLIPSRTGTTSRVITVLEAPTPVFTLPLTTYRWAIGDTISYEAGATDPNGRPFTLTMETFQQHCPIVNGQAGGCHSHSGGEAPAVQGNKITGSFEATDHDYPTYWVLRLTATNDVGASRTITRPVFSKSVTATILSEPPGMPVRFGSWEVDNAPFSNGAIPTSTVAVKAPITTTIAGAVYCFNSWSDGGLNDHNIIVPSQDFTLTVRYDTPATVNSGSPTYNPNDPCDINLERAITNAVAMGKTEIAFSPSLNLSNGITVSAPITLPTGFTLKGAGGCDTRLKVNATGSAAFILSGGNIIEGLNIETLIGPALRSKESSPGGGNIVRCSSFKVKTG
jgi:glucose/arabinose dehydrogenase/PKD repeat protein